MNCQKHSATVPQIRSCTPMKTRSRVPYERAAAAPSRPRTARLSQAVVLSFALLVPFSAARAAAKGTSKANDRTTACERRAGRGRDGAAAARSYGTRLRVFIGVQLRICGTVAECFWQFMGIGLA